MFLAPLANGLGLGNPQTSIDRAADTGSLQGELLARAWTFKSPYTASIQCARGQVTTLALRHRPISGFALALDLRSDRRDDPVFDLGDPAGAASLKEPVHLGQGVTCAPADVEAVSDLPTTFGIICSRS
jgi:hypothetical protein